MVKLVRGMDRDRDCVETNMLWREPCWARKDGGVHIEERAMCGDAWSKFCIVAREAESRRRRLEEEKISGHIKYEESGQRADSVFARRSTVGGSFYRLAVPLPGYELTL